MFLAGGWGLLLATSFVFPSLGLDWYPYPMLLLPSYLLLLVYGVVRYQVLAINAFANKALLWLAMLLLVLALMALVSALLGQLGMQALSAVPASQLWLYSALLLLLSAACYRPLAALAQRLIYPGLQLNDVLLAHWRSQLQQSANWQDLALLASRLLAKAKQHALSLGLTKLALVAVQGSVPYWQRQGFAVVKPLSASAISALASYHGEQACYMQLTQITQEA